MSVRQEKNGRPEARTISGELRGSVAAYFSTYKDDCDMTKYRKNLPQLGDKMFVTDGGMETVLVFQKGIEIAEFASIDLFRRPDGEEIINTYMAPYVEIALRAQTGLVMETATWRSSPDWGPKIGFANERELAQANRRAVGLANEMRMLRETPATPIVVSGCIGPRGDGYDPGAIMSVAEAADYHGWQASVFAGTQADMIGALTMTNVNEATGVALAAKQAGMPVAISYTVETDGHLPTGQPLSEAIMETDAATGRYPAYYMINCAHPTHFADKLIGDRRWLERIGGIRANASRCSHEELDNSETLDDGDPIELGEQMAALRDLLPNLTVVGGCCGTDHRHIGEIARTCGHMALAA